MLLALALVSALAAVPPDTLPADTLPAQTPLVATAGEPVGIGAPSIVADTNPSRRRKAVEISDGYATRLKIHYIASFAMIPLFTAQAILGEQLYHAENNGYPAPSGIKGTHEAVAITIGGLFVTNAVTGSWNWWETRHQEKGRAWRTVHAALMILGEAGFAYTAYLGTKASPNGTGGNPSRDLHRNWAEGSAAVSLASYIMMWRPIRGDK
jgi:hypothetical protein